MTQRERNWLYGDGEPTTPEDEPRVAEAVSLAAFEEAVADARYWKDQTQMAAQRTAKLKDALAGVAERLTKLQHLDLGPSGHNWATEAQTIIAAALGRKENRK